MKMDQLTKFQKYPWPTTSNPTAFNQHLANIQSAKLDENLLNFEKLKISDTLNQVDDILLDLKKKSSGTSKKSQKGLVVDIQSTRKLQPSVPVKSSEIQEAKALNLNLPSFHLNPKPHPDPLYNYTPVSIIKSSIPEKQQKVIKSIKTLEKNIYNQTLSLNSKSTSTSNFQIFSKKLSDLVEVVEEKAENLNSENSSSDENEIISKNLESFVDHKLRDLQKIIENNPNYDRRQVIQEFRDLSTLVDLVAGRAVKIQPILCKDR